MRQKVFGGGGQGLFRKGPLPPPQLPPPTPYRGWGGEFEGRAGDSLSPGPPLKALQPGRGVLLWGEEVRGLAAAAAAWAAARGTPVLVVDAANRFDPYRLVREARAQGLAPREALARVRVARAFTCHQLVRLLNEAVPPRLEPGSLVVVLGPVSLFYDEQIPLAERRRLFRDLAGRLAAIKGRAALLLLQPLLPRGAVNRHFGSLLARVMDVWVEVGGFAGEGRGKAIPPPSPTPPPNPL